MKQTELRPCCLCGKGLMHTGLPLFWRVSIERMGVDMNAVRRQAGLEQMLGSPALAFHMGLQEDLAKPVDEQPTTGLVCEECAINGAVCVASLSEAMTKATKKEPGR